MRTFAHMPHVVWRRRQHFNLWRSDEFSMPFSYFLSPFGGWAGLSWAGKGRSWLVWSAWWRWQRFSSCEKPLFMHISCSCCEQRPTVGAIAKASKSPAPTNQTKFFPPTTFDNILTRDSKVEEEEDTERGSSCSCSSRACYHSVSTSVTFYKSANAPRRPAHLLTYSLAYKCTYTRFVLLFVVILPRLLPLQLIPLMENCTSMLRENV